MVNIYYLKDPRSGDVRYIGKTVLHPTDRLKDHIIKSSKAAKPTHKEAWIKQLLLLGLTPVVGLIEIVDDSVWKEKEIFWINHYREIGFNITNISVGGDGANGVRHTEIFKADLRKRMVGNKYGVGKKWTAEAIQKRNMNPHPTKGKTNIFKHSDDWKAAASKRMSGHNHHLSKLSNEKVTELRSRYKNGERAVSLSKEVGMTYSHILKVLKNKSRIVCQVLS